MHSAVMGHVRQEVSPAQRDPAGVAELKLGRKSKKLRECSLRESGHQVLGFCYIQQVRARPVGCGCYVDIRSFQSCEVLYHFSVWPLRKR